MFSSFSSSSSYMSAAFFPEPEKTASSSTVVAWVIIAYKDKLTKNHLQPLNYVLPIQTTLLPLLSSIQYYSRKIVDWGINMCNTRLVHWLMILSGAWALSWWRPSSLGGISRGRPNPARSKWFLALEDRAEEDEKRERRDTSAHNQGQWSRSSKQDDPRLWALTFTAPIPQPS